MKANRTRNAPFSQTFRTKSQTNTAFGRAATNVSLDERSNSKTSADYNRLSIRIMNKQLQKQSFMVQNSKLDFNQIRDGEIIHEEETQIPSAQYF